MDKKIVLILAAVACLGTRPAFAAAPEVKKAGNKPVICPAVVDPVCDRPTLRTFNNECLAKAAGAKGPLLKGDCMCPQGFKKSVVAGRNADGSSFSITTCSCTTCKVAGCTRDHNLRCVLATDGAGPCNAPNDCGVATSFCGDPQTQRPPGCMLFTNKAPFDACMAAVKPKK